MSQGLCLPNWYYYCRLLVAAVMTRPLLQVALICVYTCIEMKKLWEPVCTDFLSR